MADKNPYALRNADINNLDLSEFSKDYSPEELDIVKSSLMKLQKEQQDKFDALPLVDQAKIYSGEKFGEAKKVIEENPEYLFAPIAAKSIIDIGGKAVSGTKSIYDRMIGAGNKTTTAEPAPVPQETGPKPSSYPEGLTAEVMQTPEQNRKAKLAQEQASIEGRVPQSPVERPAVQGTDAPSPVSIEQEIANAMPSSYPPGVTAETPVGKEPKDMDLVRRSEVNKLEKEIDKAKVPPKTAKSKAIPAFKSAADIPEGFVFRPDVGNLDRSLMNILGPEGRLYAKEVLNEGKMFGEYKGADYNKKVKELVGAYGEKLKEITPSIDLTTREGRIAAGAPHTQNYGSALGKAAKVGGVLGTLMTVAQSANAREAARNVGESLLPIGVTPSELQTGTLTAKQLKAFEESQKLGSPYRSVPPPKR